MREFTVHAQYDDEAELWRAANEQLPLTAEAPTLDALLTRVTVIASEMAAENGLARAGEPVTIHLVADRVTAAAAPQPRPGPADNPSDPGLPVSARFANLQSAFEFVSFGAIGEHQGFLDRHSGKVFCHSDLDDISDEDLPDDFDPDDPDGERYVEIPHKNELDLGTPLVFDFVREFLADDHDEVRQIFSRRGAYRRFKELLIRRGALDRWYEFSNKAEEAALRAWCADEGIELCD